jgi:hypothetical protein
MKPFVELRLPNCCKETAISIAVLRHPQMDLRGEVLTENNKANKAFQG